MPEGCGINSLTVRRENPPFDERPLLLYNLVLRSVYKPVPSKGGYPKNACFKQFGNKPPGIPEPNVQARARATMEALNP